MENTFKRAGNQTPHPSSRMSEEPYFRSHALEALDLAGLESFEPSRQYVIFAPNLQESSAKTAHGILNYAQEFCGDVAVAVVDPHNAGKTVGDVVPQLPGNPVPIVSTLQEALKYNPNWLAIGTAIAGGRLNPDARKMVLEALSSKLSVAAGLHDKLSEEPEIARAAENNGVVLWDLRAVKKEQSELIFNPDVWKISPYVLGTVGTDSTIGKQSAGLEVCSQAKKFLGGDAASFVATGQTGLLITGGKGVPYDAIAEDFKNGVLSKAVLDEAHENPNLKLIVVEGQGGPRTGVSLVHGAGADGSILMHRVDRKTIRGGHGGDVPTQSYTDYINFYQKGGDFAKPNHIVGISLNTAGLTNTEAQFQCEEAQRETGLPVMDFKKFPPNHKFGAEKFYRKIAEKTKNFTQKTVPGHHWEKDIPPEGRTAKFQLYGDKNERVKLVFGEGNEAQALTREFIDKDRGIKTLEAMNGKSVHIAIKGGKIIMSSQERGTWGREGEDNRLRASKRGHGDDGVDGVDSSKKLKVGVSR